MSTRPRTKLGGVYRLVCIPTGQFYIGSTKCFISRRLSHLSSFRHGRAANKVLSELGVLHGAEAFRFEMLEICPNPLFDSLKEREQSWLDRSKEDPLLINRSRYSDTNVGVRHSEEFKERARQRQMGSHNSMAGKTQTARFYEVMAKEIPPVVGPDGTRYEGETNIKQFCERHGLVRSNFQAMLRGKNHSSQGFYLASRPYDRERVESGRRAKISEKLKK